VALRAEGSVLGHRETHLLTLRSTPNSMFLQSGHASPSGRFGALRRHCSRLLQAGPGPLVFVVRLPRPLCDTRPSLSYYHPCPSGRVSRGGRLLMVNDEGGDRRAPLGEVPEIPLERAVT
jgi:hypothetical protein